MYYLYPFASFLLIKWNVVSDISQVGYYVGLFTASYNLGQFVSLMTIARVITNVERRKIVMWGGFVAILYNVAFGACRNFEEALVARFLCGLFNVNYMISKVYITELSAGKYPGRWNYIIFSWLFNWGGLCGSVIGGYLYDSSAAFDSAYGSGQGIPSLIIASLYIIQIPLTIIFLHETVPSHKVEYITDIIKCRYRTKPATNETLAIEPNIDIDVYSNISTHVNIDDNHANGSIPENTATDHANPPTITLRELLASQNIIKMLVILIIVNSVQIGFIETLSPWLVSDPKYGGVGLSNNSVGLVLIICTASAILTQLVAQVLLPWYKNVILALFCLVALFIFEVPYLSLNKDNGTVFIVMMVAIIFVCMNWIFTLMYTLIANFVQVDRISYFFGISQGITAFCNIVVPFAMDYVFATMALGDNAYNVSYVTDYHFTFNVLSLMMIAVIVTINYLKEIGSDSNNDSVNNDSINNDNNRNININMGNVGRRNSANTVAGIIDGDRNNNDDINSNDVTIDTNSDRTFVEVLSSPEATPDVQPDVQYM